jgi:hypothetical protein
MAVITAVPPQSRRTGLAAVLAGLAVVAGVTWGSGLALDRISPPDAGAAGGPGGYGITDPVPTSFGTVGVEFVRAVDGVTNRALKGGSHGVSGLVDPEHAQIQTAVSLTNDLDTPFAFKTSQFRLLVTANGKTAAQSASSGDLPNSRILPHAGIQGHLSFVVPRTGAQLALEFTDPGRAKPVVIQLGEAEFGPRAAGSHGGAKHTGSHSGANR